jgi:hypothetical protein
MVTFSVTSAVGAPLTGSVRVQENDGSGSCTVPATAGGCEIRFGSLGRRSVTATYLGDAVHLPSPSGAELHDVQLLSQ